MFESTSLMSIFIRLFYYPRNPFCQYCLRKMFRHLIVIKHYGNTWLFSHFILYICLKTIPTDIWLIIFIVLLTVVVVLTTLPPAKHDSPKCLVYWLIKLSIIYVHLFSVIFLFFCCVSFIAADKWQSIVYSPPIARKTCFGPIYLVLGLLNDLRDKNKKKTFKWQVSWSRSSLLLFCEW